MPTDQESEYITVRDRRAVYQFSIHNRVIDEWLPIIGLHGMALYCLYVRMANREDERCFPGYTLIQNHLGLGRSTISDYNKLLVWCKLIHIEPGNAVNTNDYYILDIPEVTPEALDEIRRKVEAELSPKSKFRRTVVKRLDEWQPIQALWEKAGKPEQPIVVHPAQMTLPLEGSPVAEHPSPPAEQSVRPEDSNNPKQQSERTIRKNNPKEQSEATATAAAIGEKTAYDTAAVRSLLIKFGIQEPTLSELTDKDLDPAVVQAWIWHVGSEEGLTRKPGYVVKRLRASDEPPADLLALARIMAQLDDAALDILAFKAKERRWTGRWNLDDERLEELLDEETLETYLQVMET